MAKKGNNVLALGVGLNIDPLNEGFNEAAKAAKDGMGKVATEVVASGAKVQESSQKAADKVQSLRTQFRQATQDAQQMAEKYGIMSTQAIAAASRAGELKDNIGDINTVITAFSADSKFTVVAGALQQAAGAASIVTGAMGLLGTESKATQEMLLKVQSALALTQGLAQLKEMGAAFTALQAVIVGKVIPSIMLMKTATIAATGGAILVIGAIVAAVISYNNALDAEAEAHKKVAEAAKLDAEANKKVGDIVAETTAFRLAAMKDGIAKDKALLQEKTNQELRSQYDRYKAGEIAEFTYNQRVKYIREAAYNELANLEEKYAKIAEDRAKKIKPIERKQASSTNQLPGRSLPQPTAPHEPLRQYETSFSIAAKKAALSAQKHLEQLNTSINQSIQSTLGSTFASIGQMLGEGIVNGFDDPFASLTALLLKSFGSLMVQMGNAYIAFGIADLKFKTAIFTGQPWLAIGAGIALVAAGSAISAIAGNMTKAPSPSGGPSPLGGNNLNNSGQFKSFNGNLDNTIEIEGVVRGNNIELVNRKNMNKVGRSLIL